MRRLEAAQVSATVSNGGRILASPGRQLTAAVSDGGIVTYWGKAEVTSSVRRGGAVVQGESADLRTPIAGLDPPLPPLRALRPIQAVPRPRDGEE